MKHFSLFLITLAGFAFAACTGQTSKKSEQRDTLQASDQLIGETDDLSEVEQSLMFKSLHEAINAAAPDEEVVGVWSHSVGGKAQFYIFIYRANGLSLLRNVYVEKNGYRLDDVRLSIPLKRVSVREYADLQNDGGYRMLDSTLINYDAQNNAAILGGRVFNWKD